jgi:hypothetical protein
MAELYPSIIPVKPDVDMVVTPEQLSIATGNGTATVVTDTPFEFSAIPLDQPLNQSSVLQLCVEYSLNTTAGVPADYSIYVSPDGTVASATQASRDISITQKPNWLTGTVYFTLFKDVDWDSSVGVIRLGLQGLAATPATPVFAGSGMAFSYTITNVP